MKKAEFQQLADERAIDAQALLGAQRWTAAYYIAGYAVECALKACILSHLEQHPEEIFREKRFSEKCWTHSIVQLVALAGLESDRINDTIANPQFGIQWEIAKDWGPESRYRQITENEARKLVAALTDTKDGVLPWLKARW